MDKLGIVRELGGNGGKDREGGLFQGAIDESDDEDDGEYMEDGGEVKMETGEGVNDGDADVKMEGADGENEGFVKTENFEDETAGAVKTEGLETELELPIVEIKEDVELKMEDETEPLFVASVHPVEEEEIKQEEPDAKPKFRVKENESSSDDSDLEVLAPPVKKIITPKPTKKGMFERLKKLSEEQADRERSKRDVIIQARMAELEEKDREKEEKERIKAEREAVVEETRRVAREEKVKDKLAVKAAKAALVASQRYVLHYLWGKCGS